MKKTTLLKIGFDILMTIVLLALMAYAFTGNYVHELMGLGVLIAFILHNLFNIKWIVNVTKKVFRGETDWFSALKYIVNLLLLIFVVAVGGSGILISNSFFTNLTTENRALWVCIHNISAALTIMCVGVHIGLHWQLIMAAFKKMFGLKNDCMPRRIVLRILALCLAVLGIKALISQPFTEYFTLPQTDADDAQKLDLSDVQAQNNAAKVQAMNVELTANSFTMPSIELTRDKGTAYFDFSTNPPTDGESLESYLGRLHCTGCGKQCLLTSPQCSTGQNLAVQGQEYYSTYFSAQAETTAPETTAPETAAPEMTAPQTTTPQETTPPQTTTEDSITSQDSSKSSDDSSQLSSDNSSQSDIPTLDEYLGSLHCTGCGRQCLLTNPQCQTGVSQASKATSDYNSLYAYKAESESADSDNRVQELIFEDDSTDSLLNIFTVMVPVMGLYAGGTYYAVKIVRSVSGKKKKNR